MSLTTDKNDPNLNKVKDNGQNEVYLVLSDEEKAKGFIRPYRDTYVHVGINWNNISHKIIPVGDKYKDKYVAILYHVKDEKTGEFIGGRYITKEELDQIKKSGYTGGCGVLTRMHQSIAETYARDPKFYSATFCCGCHKHLPVSEFVWDGTNEQVGS